MDLETFAPEPRVLDVAGRRVRILPLRARQFPKFTRLVSSLLPLILAGDLVLVMLDHYDAARDCIGVATDTEAAWLDDLAADEFLALLTVVVEVNADFFTARLGPAIKAANEKIAAALTRDGSISSPTFPNAATG